MHKTDEAFQARYEEAYEEGYKEGFIETKQAFIKAMPVVLHNMGYSKEKIEFLIAEVEAIKIGGNP